MQIGSTEHKELFCRSLVESHRAYEPADLPWPELDDLSLARLRAIPIWTLALEVELGAGVICTQRARPAGARSARTAGLRGRPAGRSGSLCRCDERAHARNRYSRLRRGERTLHGLVRSAFTSAARHSSARPLRAEIFETIDRLRANPARATPAGEGDR